MSSTEIICQKLNYMELYQRHSEIEREGGERKRENLPDITWV